MNEISVVIGLGFGDEGKGATVNALCSINPKNSLVIRFNGGHQVGHTVRHGDILHPFSNFGSGTLQGVPTYWTEYCTMNPVAVIREGSILIEKGITPKIFYNPNVMVTTPFDIIQNHNDENNQLHGTVGVGFGTTIQRNEDHYHLYVRDLFYPDILHAKLKNILNYYHYVTPLNAVSQRRYDEFMDYCNLFIEKYEYLDFNKISGWNYDLIFEGGQGIMLDTEYGFFPNVTRSYSTSRNAMEFINKHQLANKNAINRTYYVIRAYQTRHGNGYMSNEGMPITYIKPNPTETNVDTGNQGIFRKSILDFDLLEYAISCDRQHNTFSDKKLVITCLDQIDGNEIPITKNNRLYMATPKEIGVWLNIPVITSDSDRGFLHN